MPDTPIKALFFDVFGTLVDFRTGVAREAERLIAPTGKTLDWGAFADAWRGEYQAGMEEIRSGREGYVRLDIIHRRNLDRILPRFGLEHLDEDTRAELNLAWHRLDAWPEVPAALARLRTQFRIAPLSNGNIALQVDLARRNNFLWDAILGGDFSRDYKPKAQIYLDAVDAFGLKARECLMVACHSSDLAAAASHGLHTAHIARPDEHGAGRGETAPSVTVDFAAADLADLAEKLLIPR
ncbi:MAG: haloacid dehalogenase type II [Methylovirgula sp.]|uniref:haloacid dehalogenase type II n=1 Tax=Methylovirgula sp. TaxID=1978224 RepID=UPI00307602FA